MLFFCKSNKRQTGFVEDLGENTLTSFIQSCKEENNCIYMQITFTEDGLMTYEEFAAGARPGSPPLSVEEAFDFWDSIDIEKNNEIDSTCPVVFFYLLDTNSKLTSFQTRPIDTKPKCVKKLNE